MKQLFVLFWLALSASLMSPASQAASDWGPCVPKSGTYYYSTSYNKTITNPGANYAGSTFANAYSWALGGRYSGICECPDDMSAPPPTYYKADSSLPPGHNDGMQFYVINENLEAAVQFMVIDHSAAGWEVLKNVPFYDHSNGNNTDVECSQKGGGTGFSSGSQGNMTLYISHPFVGTSAIPEVVIASIYGTKKPGSYSPIPMASVLFSGSITVEQGCEIEGGTTVNINLGEYNARDFKGVNGEIPANGTSQRVNLKFKCNNVSDGVQAYIRIEGTTNINDPRAIEIGSPEFGVLVKDASGNILIPNDGTSFTKMRLGDWIDNNFREGQLDLVVHPVAITGKLPKAGVYEGIATLWLDVE